MPSYEIEIKSLLGDAASAAQFKSALLALNPTLTGVNQQLNHYFEGWNLPRLYEKIAPHLSEEDRERFAYVRDNGANFSVRTRQQDERVLLVVKASVDDTTSANGIARLEFEAETPDLTLDQLDDLVQAAGYGVQAKWSRQREQYQLDDVTVCLDKNAGYGYLAEFEIVVDAETAADTAKQQIYDLMQRLDVEELPQDRLERMFAFYNAQWRDYYGTENVFTIK